MQGNQQSLIAVVSGKCEITTLTLISAGGQIASGRLRAIAVTSRKRLPQLPAVPTIAESGVPQYEFNSWVGVLAPASTPEPIVRHLHEHVVKAARAPEVKDRLEPHGVEIVESTPEAFRATIATETALWAKVI